MCCCALNCYRLNALVQSLSHYLTHDINYSLSHYPPVSNTPQLLAVLLLPMTHTARLLCMPDRTGKDQQHKGILIMIAMVMMVMMT
jgi:hypothetical protein